MNTTFQEILLLAGLAIAALLLGWLTGAFGWAFFTTAVVWGAIQYRERSRLALWSKTPLRRPLNALDPWQDSASRLYRAIGRARARHLKTLSSLRALRSIADALPDAVIILDSHGAIENLNSGARMLLKLTDSDHGNHLSSLVRDPDLNALIRHQVDGDIVEFASPINPEVRLEARRIDQSADPVRSMLLIRDVTELNRLLSMRQDFIANVSHELRTPLTVMVGYLETLQDGDLDLETINDVANRMRAPTNRMRALVDDLLLLTRLESSPSPAEEELVWVDMHNIANAICSDARILSGGRHQIEVTLQCAARVRGVASELHSACLNLVTNAVRYSPDGGAINIRWETVAGGARFAVEDHGLGIARAHLSRLTERFYQIDLVQARVRGGTGLGLAIVKHILKRHNTQLEVHSQLGHGSTFFCVFKETQLERD
ncbi:MAG: phosphate regulon sensor histidine kinase PhoR [Proteobacteria bacterium]|nr:phosphate regulon sensor histidine kinase PhoR [Pseudomonadota bacterium]